MYGAPNERPCHTELQTSYNKPPSTSNFVVAFSVIFEVIFKAVIMNQEKVFRINTVLICNR